MSEVHNKHFNPFFSLDKYNTLIHKMQDPPPLPYLAEKVSKNYDLSLEVFQRTFTCM
jgi:hypothetical protein